MRKPGAEKEQEKKNSVLEKWGWASIGVNVGLSGLNLAMAYISGSIAVAAEMVHNLVDLSASVAVLVGLKLSQRKSRSFPFGLYKLENLVAAVVAILIFLAAYEIAWQALFKEERIPVVTPLVLGGVMLSAMIPLVFSFFEMRAGRAANSPSLMADAQEYRVHVLTSGVVLAALLGHLVRFRFDRFAALVVAVVVVKTGWGLLVDTMRVLLDASLAPETLAQARRIIEKEPAVVQINALRGRNAGRYRFLEAEVEVRLRELDRADRMVRRLEEELRKKIPHVERALIEAKSFRGESLRIALPIEAQEGPPCEHFGVAPLFLIVDKHRVDGVLIRKNVLENPFSGDPRGRGIKVAHWLIEQKVDVVITPDDIREKGPGHALGEAGIEVIFTKETTVTEDLEKGWKSLPDYLVHVRR